MATITGTLQGADDIVLLKVIPQIVHGKFEGLCHCTVDADVVGGAIEMRVDAVVTVVGISTRGEERGCKILEIGLTIEWVFG